METPEMTGPGSAETHRIRRARILRALQPPVSADVIRDLPGPPWPFRPVGDHPAPKDERAPARGEGASGPAAPRLDEARAEAAKTLAHELRQPLGAITNLTGAALNAIEGQAATLQRLHDLLIAIRREAQRAADIVRSVGDVMAGGAVRGAGDVLLAIDAVIARMRPALVDAVIDLEIERPAGLPTVRGDQTVLEQIFHNVITNAVEEMANVPIWTRRLTVRARAEPGGTVLVEIADTGRGIPEALADRIFEPLVTGKSTGWGVGLHVVRTLLQRMGGSIDARPGEACGTVFSIRLAPAQ